MIPPKKFQMPKRNTKISEFHSLPLFGCYSISDIGHQFSAKIETVHKYLEIEKIK